MIDLIISWESRPAAAQTSMSSLHREISKKHTVAGRLRRTVARAPITIKHAFPTANKLAI
jgi:hypothetical protein